MAESRNMTKQEIWDFLDRGGFVKWEGEYWVKTDQLDKEISGCDCLACQVQRAFNLLNVQSSEEPPI